MIRNSTIARLHESWQGIRAAKDGSTTTIFALAMVPVFGLIGATVDYSRASSMRAAMQNAVDTTALAIATAAPSQTSDQLHSSAESYFNAVFTRPDAQNIHVSATYSAANGTAVVVNASATVKTSFMRVMGLPNISVSASGTAAYGMSRLRVALVLDNTGSMADAGKIGALKTAAKNLIDQLKGSATNNGDVYVSIVPFNKDVNVGAARYAASWIRWTDWDAANGGWQLVSLPSWPDAASAVGVPQWNGTWPSLANPVILAKHDVDDDNRNGDDDNNGKAKKTNTWVPNSHSTWNGCVTDRDQDYDIRNTVPDTGIAATLFPAEQYSTCPVEMMALSYDWMSLKSKIDSMSPNGNTNQSIGLAWGWLSLMQGSPLNAPAEDPNYTYQKIIILLSDGLNTQNRWTTDEPTIDARQQLLCNNINAARVTIYTIQVNTGGDPTSKLLKNCASDTSKWFVLTQANQIVSTFKQIGTNISKLRIAK